MKKKIALLIISFSLASCSSKIIDAEISCLQIVDRNGITKTITSEEKLLDFEKTNFDNPQSYKSVLRIYNKNERGDVFSKLTAYHDNGQTFKYLEIKNARAFGKFKQWYENGNLKIEATIIGGSADFSQSSSWLFDGLCKSFDENGNLLSKYNYEKGSLQGETKYFYPTGEIKKIEPFVNNEIHGILIEYKKNGLIHFKSSYKNGVLDGTSLGYYSEDNISFMEDYANGLLINAQYFKKSRIKISGIKNGDGQKAVFKNNKLYQLIEYKNGIALGKVQTFNSLGELKNEYYQKNQIKDGLEIEYYNVCEINNLNKKNRNVKLEINWDNGAIHGFVKTWYKNFKLESQKEYFHNKKNSKHFAWYQNGDVMFIEEYELDLLQSGSYYKLNQKDPISKVINGNGIATLFDEKGRLIKKIKYVNGLPNS